MFNKVKSIRHSIENKMVMKKAMEFINSWYPVILAFAALIYSVSLGLIGLTEEAQYSAHWPGTILLFAIAIRQRRLTNPRNKA